MGPVVLCNQATLTGCGPGVVPLPQGHRISPSRPELEGAVLRPCWPVRLYQVGNTRYSGL
jgi:hypothetical protein